MTKVEPECLRKASVAEQMSWSITTKEKALFEVALNKENLSWEKSLLDESGELHDSEMPDTVAGSPKLEEEGNAPLNDDCDPPISEPPIAEKEVHSEDETQVEEPDLVTKDSRDIVREPLRLPQRRPTSKQPPPSGEQEGTESKSKRAHVNVSELLHDASLAKAARSKEKQWYGLGGREKLLFFEAVSKQLNAWQESAAATVIPPAEAIVIWRTLRKQGLQDRVMQSRFVLVDKNGGKSTAENPLGTKASARIVVPGYADPQVLDIRRDSPSACREAISVLLAIGTGRANWTLLTADVQAAFPKGEFQDKDLVLCCWQPQNGPALPEFNLAVCLLLILKRVFWIGVC